MLKYLFFLTLFRVTWQLNQLLPNELYELSDDSSFVNKWNQIKKSDQLNLANDYELGQAPKFAHGSPSDVGKYLLNSIIAGCGGNPNDTISCVCPSIYEGIEIIENEEMGSLSVVTTNKLYKQVVVSYRASSVKRNQETSFDLVQVDADFIEGVKVHQGFLKHYQTLRPGTQAAVIKLLNQPRYANYTLHVTGYSLGASTSTISAIDWVNLLRKRNDKRKIEIYAYAGPRVGNKAFVDSLGSLNIPITRFTSSNDIVPHLPPRISGYLHAGTELYYDPKIARVRVCSDKVYEDPTCNQRHIILSGKAHTTPFDKPRPPGKCPEDL